jgi:hypothetical protein
MTFSPSPLDRYSIGRNSDKLFPFRIESSAEYHPCSSSMTVSVTVVVSYDNNSSMKMTNILSKIPLPSLQSIDHLSHSVNGISGSTATTTKQCHDCTVTGHTSFAGVPEIQILIPKLKSKCQLCVTISLTVRLPSFHTHPSPFTSSALIDCRLLFSKDIHPN